MEIMDVGIPGGFPNLKHLTIAHLISGEKANSIAEHMSESTELEWWTGGFYCHDWAAVVRTTLFLHIGRRRALTSPNSTIANHF